MSWKLKDVKSPSVSFLVKMSRSGSILPTKASRLESFAVAYPDMRIGSMPLPLGSTPSIYQPQEAPLTYVPFEFGLDVAEGCHWAGPVSQPGLSSVGISLHLLSSATVQKGGNVQLLVGQSKPSGLSWPLPTTQGIKLPS